MKKWMNLVFCAAFLLAIALPLANMETEGNKRSMIDNAYLPKLEDIRPEHFGMDFEEYFAKRIGFREWSLHCYELLNDRLFGRLEHPLYMYGKEGHIFFRGNEYIRAYQHLNLNEAGAEAFADSVRKFQDYCQAQGKDFLYMLIPDKETVYPEYYPDTVNVYGETSLSDQVMAELEKRQVSFFYCKDAMLEGKKSLNVNNVKYDAGHWNQHGAFFSIQALFEVLRQNHPQIQALTQEEFDITMETQEFLDISTFVIREQIPRYALKNNRAEKETEGFFADVALAFPNNHFCHYRNPQCSDQPKLLIFGDSYLAGYEQFLNGHFREYTYIHRYNLCNQEFFEYYVDLVDPDIVILENPERSLIYDLNQDISLKDLLAGS